MRLIMMAMWALMAFVGCNRNTSPNSIQTNRTHSLAPAEGYKPNPNEVVISAKLISYQDGVATVEVVKQMATGFGAKAVFGPGDELSLSMGTKPLDNFICAFEFIDTIGDQKTYHITKFLK